jgi:hypothetical protein
VRWRRGRGSLEGEGDARTDFACKNNEIMSIKGWTVYRDGYDMLGFCKTFGPQVSINDTHGTKNE